MDIFGILSMIGGLALFLYGMEAMGAGLSKLSGGRMERLLEKLTSKRITMKDISAEVRQYRSYCLNGRSGFILYQLYKQRELSNFNSVNININTVDAGAEELFLFFKRKLVSSVVYLYQVRLIIFKVPLYTIRLQILKYFFKKYS